MESQSTRPAEPGFVAICRDAADAPRLRQEALAAHFAHIETTFEELEIAGPLYGDDGQTTVGSLFILRTRDAAHARAIVERDPYFKAGVWSRVDYHPFLPAAGRYIGGKIW